MSSNADSGEQEAGGEDYEEPIFAEYNQRFRPYPYRQVFYPAVSGSWHIDALFPEAFFEAAKLLLEGIVHGSLNPLIEGFPALFLSRP